MPVDGKVRGLAVLDHVVLGQLRDPADHAEIALKARKDVRRVDRLHPAAVQGEDLKGFRHRIAMLHLTQYRSVYWGRVLIRRCSIRQRPAPRRRADQVAPGKCLGSPCPGLGG